MNKTELIESIQAKLGEDATKAQAEQALSAVTESIAAGIQQDDKKGVQILGFGTFKVSHRAERMGRNPQTGEPMQIKASKSVRFVPAAALKGSL